MKVGALLGALLMLLGITSASATIRIHDDPGGRIDRYLQKFAKLRHSGERIIVDGTCNSACTLLLGTIPRARICVTERASLGFHAAWVFDGQGRQIESPGWTSVLWRNYPQSIRDWINRNGGLTPRMIFLRGNELMAMFGRPPGPWLRPIKDHLLGLVIDGALSPDDKEEAARIARTLLENE